MTFRPHSKPHTAATATTEITMSVVERTKPMQALASEGAFSASAAIWVSMVVSFQT